MKKLSFVAVALITLLATACSVSTSGPLFDGSSIDKWSSKGNVTVKEKILTLKGEDAAIVLKNGKYKNFNLSLELKTTPGGKGELWFHTDDTMKKGYKVAINNDREDKVWWKMSGSLISVRNLTKSFVKEGEWFKLDLYVAGQEINIDINGEPVVEYIEPSAPFRSEANAKALLSDGTFGIISNGKGEIQIKSITVNVIKDDSFDVNSQLTEANDEQNDEIIKLHQEDFPVLDYHVHLKGGLTKEVAAKQSRKTGINYAIAPNCGVGFPITNDEQVMAFLKEMRTQPFILAMQAEGREWLTTFSPDIVKEFDYVFTDALTFKDNKGRRTRLWMKDETWIENEQKYMDMIIDRICDVLKEPVDIYVNPCFLPDPMDKRYNEFWTEARMDRFVEALAKSGKALEINELYNIPSKAIILKAKAAGVKFTFGSNNVTPNVSDLSYSLRMKKECGLTANDMYKPKIKI